MHGDGAGEWLLAVEAITEAGIELLVRRHQLVGEEPDTGMAGRHGQRLGMREQVATEALPWKGGATATFSIRVQPGSSTVSISARKRVAQIEQVDAVIAHGLVVIGRHRPGLAADQGDPFRIGFADQRANGDGVGGLGSAQG